MKSDKEKDKVAAKDCRYNESGNEKEDVLELFILDNAPLVINTWTSDMRLVATNGEISKRYGVASREEYFLRFSELSPEIQPCGTPSSVKAIECVKKGFELGKHYFEWMHQHLDGTPIPSEIHCVRHDNPYNGESYLYTYCVDISRVEESKRMLSEANERTQMVFDNSTIFIEHWDKDCNLIDCNKATIDFFGFATKEDYLQEYTKILSDAPIYGKGVNEYLRSNIRMAFDTGFNRFELRCKKFSGEEIIVDIEAVRMNLGSEDVVISYGTDITELRETMDLIKESEERINIMLKGTPIACYLIDQDLGAIDCNKEALNLLQLTGKSESIELFNRVAFNASDNTIKQHFQKAIEKGTHIFEFEIVVSEELTIPTEITMIHFRYRKQDVAALYIHDLRVINQMVEEKHRAEIAEENSQAKSRFLARMSHELRTPLTAVLGISEINLKDTALSSGTSEAFTRIHSASRLLLSIVNDILDLSRIEAGKVSILTEKYEVASLISDTINLNLFRLGSKRVSFHANISPNIPAYLIGDEIRIKQICNNLMSNAFKYTDKGSVTFSIENYSISPLQEMLVFTLEDTGQGMTKEQLQALNDEYVRFNEKQNRFVEGTGLGIQIVYGLVELMGATISIESEKGVGTTVILHLPQERVSEEIIGQEAAESIERFEHINYSSNKLFQFEPEPMPYGSVLVVDDVETNIYVAKGILEMYKLVVETCDSGPSAIKRIENGNIYDIIFMDHMMPEMDGMEAVKIIREKGYTGTIVALTANAIIGQAQEFLKNGFDGFVAKPIEIIPLDTVLKKFIKDKQPKAVIEATQLQSSQAVANQEVLNFFANPKDNSSDFAKKLRQDFAREQKSANTNIRKALENNDFSSAYRFAHTIKGTAGLIGEDTLKNLAARVELIFKDNEMPGHELQEMLNELDLVLSKIEPPEHTIDLQDIGTVKVDKKKLVQILNKLEAMLKSRSIDSVDLVQELRGTPETAVLIRQVDDLDFGPALVTLEVLRDVLGV